MHVARISFFGSEDGMPMDLEDLVAHWCLIRILSSKLQADSHGFLPDPTRCRLPIAYVQDACLHQAFRSEFRNSIPYRALIFRSLQLFALIDRFRSALTHCLECRFPRLSLRDHTLAALKPVISRSSCSCHPVSQDAYPERIPDHRYEPSSACSRRSSVKATEEFSGPKHVT